MTQQEELEKLKIQQEYALQLEEVKWQYKQQELAYVEAGNHMRALNLLMWQVPSIAIAVTGGLWYGAANLQVAEPRAWVFAFAAFANVGTIPTLWRLRSLIQNELQKQATFESITLLSSKRIVIGCWTAVLLAAAMIGILGATNAEKFNAQPNPGTTQLVSDKLRQTMVQSPIRSQASEPALLSSGTSGTKMHRVTPSRATSSPSGKQSS